MIIEAKNYITREDLENYIRSNFGLTTESKIDHTISGTREELQNIGLSDTTTFWGIKCVITDTPTEEKSINKVKRT